MRRNMIALLDNDNGQALIKEICRSNGMLFPEFQELIQAEVDQIGKQHRRGLFDAFDDILDRIEVDDEG